MSSSKTPKGTLRSPANESELIERGREMGEWRKVLEVVESSNRLPNNPKNQLTNSITLNQLSSSSNSPLMSFLVLEAQLESWLEEHEPTESYIQKAKVGLLDIKKGLIACLNTAPEQSGLRTDVRVLLGKLYYASGLYEEALEELKKSAFDGVSEQSQSVRNLQLMAEAHAIRAHSLEKVGKTVRGGRGFGSEKEMRTEILRSYSRSSELAVHFFQGQEKLLISSYPPTGNNAQSYTFSPSNTTPISFSPGATTISPHPQNWEKRRPSSLLDFAIRRPPTLLLEDEKTDEALLRISKLLRSYDTHFFTPIRLQLYRKGAEVLLRHKFIPPPKLTQSEINGVLIKYHTGSGLFTPKNLWEDILLILLLSESIVVREGVLNQAPEFSKARKLANLNASTIFDLLCLAAGRWGRYSLVNEGIEQALKFSFEESHIWVQYGLSFIACGLNSVKSQQTILEAAKLAKTPTPLLLLAAQQSFSRLLVDEGMRILREAKEGEAKESKLMSRIYLYEGIGYFLASFEKHMNSQRVNDLELSLESLHKSVELDSNDFLSLHWLSRVLAWTGNCKDSLYAASTCLKLHPHHLPTLQLLILLLSADRNYSDALSITESALDQYPDHLGFLQLKAALENKLFGPNNALSTVRQMLVVWKTLFDEGFGSSFGMRSESPDYKFGLTSLQLPSPTDRESSVASFRGGSIAGSSTNTGTLTMGFRGDSALSEIASSVSLHGYLSQASASELAWTAQINIWVMLTELYLELGEPQQALSSIDEAAQIAAAHPLVLYYRGKIEESVENYKEARLWYESAVGVKPTLIKGLQSLALMQHYFNSHRLAEKTLEDALKLDPYDHHTWYNLGKVLEALGECSEAGDCMATALEIEATNPILPYSTIPICFQ